MIQLQCQSAEFDARCCGHHAPGEMPLMGETSLRFQLGSHTAQSRTHKTLGTGCRGDLTHRRGCRERTLTGTQHMSCSLHAVRGHQLRANQSWRQERAGRIRPQQSNGITPTSQPDQTVPWKLGECCYWHRFRFAIMPVNIAAPLPEAQGEA